MTGRFEKSRLWQSTLASSEPDGEKEAREVLRSSLLKMRENVGQLVSRIPADCGDLTVHDLSHLDALWDIADTIAGENFRLTPAEAFVFGAAVLVHDAGLTAAAYPNGLDSLRDNPS